MDYNLTKEIEAFLALEKPSDEEVKAASLILLRIDKRSRSIYNTAQVRPQSMLPWIRTELQKNLNIFRRGLTQATVKKYNDETVKRVKDTLAKVPEGVKVEKTASLPELGTRGKRSDHDTLPENIQALWDKNAERWQKMRKYHAQLAQMIAKPDYKACDGNELCYQLRQMDDELRKTYAEYDSYSPTVAAAAEKKENADSVDAFTDNMKTIQAARTAISRGLQRKEQTEDSLEKMQEAVNTLFRLKQVVKPQTLEKLKAAGVVIPTDNA